MPRSKSLFKQMLKSRTVVFGGLVATLGVIEANAQLIPEEYRGYTLMAIGVASIWLRLMTTSSVGEK